MEGTRPLDHRRRPHAVAQRRRRQTARGAPSAAPLAARRLTHVSFASLWSLDPAVDYLNHGSFGACPTAVLAHQAVLRAEMEREPVDFLSGGLAARIDAARAAVAEFLGAEPADLVFVPNATAGVNAVLRSLTFEPGDEILITTHTY